MNRFDGKIVDIKWKLNFALNYETMDNINKILDKSLDSIRIDRNNIFY